MQRREVNAVPGGQAERARPFQRVCNLLHNHVEELLGRIARLGERLRRPGQDAQVLLRALGFPCARGDRHHLLAWGGWRVVAVVSAAPVSRPACPTGSLIVQPRPN